MTPLQEKILQFITFTINDEGHSPTLNEIGDAVGVNSRGTIHRYVQELIEMGHLQRNPRGWRGLRLAGEVPARHARLPLAGRIAAGRPLEAIPDTEEVDLAALLVADDRYALQVRGDSMIDAGILDGDLVIIRHAQTAQDDDIVVALIDNEEATLKRYRQAGKQISLIPENREMTPMLFDAARVTIQGVLVGQLRTY